MTAATAATTTEAVPFSTEEMREAVAELDERDYARAVATAAALERATNWILAHERDAGKAPIPALRTVGEALADPVAAVRLEDGAQVVAFAPAGLEVRAFTAEDLDERGLPRVKP